MKKANNTEQKLFITAEQTGFDPLTRNISRNTFLSDIAVRLYAYINSQQNENFYLSAESIARYLHKSTRTIERAIQELKENGFLTLEKRENSKNYYYKLRTSPKLEQLKTFDTETILNAYFNKIIDIDDIGALYKKKVITYNDFEKVINRIVEIAKTKWLDED